MTLAGKASRLSLLRRQGGSFLVGPRARVRISGADSLRYLNGQVSNDLRRLKAGEAMAALVLTAKGQLCADVFVWREAEAFVLEADGSLEDSLSQRLERYAIADDVSFEVLEQNPSRCHVFGPELPDGLVITRIGVRGVDTDSVPAGMMEASPGEMDLLRIERGIPEWGRELTPGILPQEAGLDRTAVDFHKGCYVGQEVVSRIESVGRVNRRLCGWIGNFDPLLAVSAAVCSGGGEKVGTITTAAVHPELEKSVALGFLSTRCTESIFSVRDESGACLGTAERSEFPLVA